MQLAESAGELYHEILYVSRETSSTKTFPIDKAVKQISTTQ